MADLYERLKRIRSSKGAAVRSGAVPSGPRVPGKTVLAARRLPGHDQETADSGPAVALGPEWRPVSPLVFVRDTTEDVGAVLGAESGASAAGSLHSRLLGREIEPGSLCFMDTETTGLSGGAGTTVFLVGAGRLDGRTLRVRQVLLVDFPGEPEFLREVARNLDAGIWVSYNGKSFDARLLESRFLMNGVAPMAAEQLDLLYWSRRLWRSDLGSCTLGDIEHGILNRRRTDDIPGVEIPERYFRFLRTRDGGELDEVFEHHRLDIVSLVHLFFRLEAVLANPLGERRVDWYRLGRWLTGTDEDVATPVLERAVERCVRPDAVRAALLLSRLYRRRGRSEEALRILTRVGCDGELPVLTEAAKILEHDLRDPARARDRILAFLDGDGVNEATVDALVHRLRRLERKVER